VTTCCLFSKALVFLLSPQWFKSLWLRMMCLPPARSPTLLQTSLSQLASRSRIPAQATIPTAQSAPIRGLSRAGIPAPAISPIPSACPTPLRAHTLPRLRSLTTLASLIPIRRLAPLRFSLISRSRRRPPRIPWHRAAAHRSPLQLQPVQASAEPFRSALVVCLRVRALPLIRRLSPPLVPAR